MPALLQGNLMVINHTPNFAAVMAHSWCRAPQSGATHLSFYPCKSDVSEVCQMRKGHLNNPAPAASAEPPGGAGIADLIDADAAMDHEGLRRMLARDAIRFELLPLRRADRMWGGACHGATCTVCGLTISPEELGYELEFAQEGREWASHFLHVRCFAAWESECRKAKIIESGTSVGLKAEKHPDDDTLFGNGRLNGQKPKPAR
jgi:hypothetical protein